MQVKYLISRHPISITKESTIYEAIIKMRDADQTTLPVCEHGKLIGVITAQDVVINVLANELDLHSIKVEDIMDTQAPLCCFEDDLCEQAKLIMDNNCVSSLAVLNKDMYLVGMISIDNILTKMDNIIKNATQTVIPDQEDG